MNKEEKQKLALEIACMSADYSNDFGEGVKQSVRIYKQMTGDDKYDGILKIGKKPSYWQKIKSWLNLTK